MTPEYTVIKKGKKFYNVYSNSTGEQIDLAENPVLSGNIKDWGKQVDQRLSISDKINNQNLLRFYTPDGFKPVDPNDDKYEYKDQLNRLLKTRDDEGNSSTSMYSQNNDDSSTGDYETDAPELKQSDVNGL